MKSHVYIVGLIVIAMLICCWFLPPEVEAKRLHLEKWYQQQQCPGGAKTLQDGTEVDCLTDTHAIEFDFANKWYEAVGQSLHYAMLTGRRAGIYLIIEKESDLRHLKRLRALINHYGLPIDIVDDKKLDLLLFRAHQSSLYVTN